MYGSLSIIINSILTLSNEWGKNMEKIKKNPDSTPGRPKQQLSGRQIQSVQRAVNILNCFTATNPALTLGQISSRLNLNKGTVHGILNTLRNSGYISQNMAGQYMLGAELFNKACLAPDTRKKVCVDHGHDRLQELSDEFQANGTLFSVADGRLLVLDATEPANCAFIVRRATPEISLYGSASGKIALAYLPPKEQKAFLARAPFPALTDRTKITRESLLEEFEAIRQQGYSFENDELFMGVSAIAVPIFNQYGHQLFGTMSLTGMTQSIEKNREPIVKALSEAVRRLQHYLQF